MGDQDNGFAVRRQIVHDMDQLCDFLRGKAGGGFVQDQGLCAAIQRFQNFHALLHTHADILDLGVRVNGQIVLFRKLHHIFACGGHVQRQSLYGLHAKGNVFRNRKRLHQHKVLVYHADACFDRLFGRIQEHGLSVYQNLTAGG